MREGMPCVLGGIVVLAVASLLIASPASAYPPYAVRVLPDKDISVQWHPGSSNYALVRDYDADESTGNISTNSTSWKTDRYRVWSPAGAWPYVNGMDVLVRVMVGGPPWVRGYLAVAQMKKSDVGQSETWDWVWGQGEPLIFSPGGYRADWSDPPYPAWPRAELDGSHLRLDGKVSSGVATLRVDEARVGLNWY